MATVILPFSRGYTPLMLFHGAIVEDMQANLYASLLSLSDWSLCLPLANQFIMF